MVTRSEESQNSAWNVTEKTKNKKKSKTCSLFKAVLCDSQSNQILPNGNKKKYSSWWFLPTSVALDLNVICYIHQFMEACGSLSKGICQTVSSVWPAGTQHSAENWIMGTKRETAKSLTDKENKDGMQIVTERICLSCHIQTSWQKALICNFLFWMFKGNFEEYC